MNNKNISLCKNLLAQLQPRDLCLLKGDPDGFIKRYINEEIGHGVFTTKNFQEGAALLEYKGVACSALEGKIKLESYERRKLGSYIFFFKSNGKEKCIDATLTMNLARWVNDSPEKSVNCRMKRMVINNVDHLYLVATKAIFKNEELRYSYNANNLNWRENKENHNQYIYLEEENRFVNSSMVQERRISKESNCQATKMENLFLKVADIENCYRPLFYQGTNPKQQKFMQSHSNSHEELKDFCEICGFGYADLQKHLKSKTHTENVKTKSNYDEIDEIITADLSFHSFLQNIVAPSGINEKDNQNNNQNVSSTIINNIDHHVNNDSVAPSGINEKDNQNNHQNVSSTINNNIDPHVNNGSGKSDASKTPKIVDVQLGNAVLDFQIEREKTISKQNNISKVTRTVKTCPYCQRQVKDLPKHLSGKKHGITEMQRKTFVNRAGLRKPYERKNETTNSDNAKKKYKKRERECCICGAVVINPGPHLTGVHKIVFQSKQYYDMMKNIKTFDFKKDSPLSHMPNHSPNHPPGTTYQSSSQSTPKVNPQHTHTLGLSTKDIDAIMMLSKNPNIKININLPTINSVQNHNRQDDTPAFNIKSLDCATNIHQHDTPAVNITSLDCATSIHQHDTPALNITSLDCATNIHQHDTPALNITSLDCATNIHQHDTPALNITSLDCATNIHQHDTPAPRKLDDIFERFRLYMKGPDANLVSADVNANEVVRIAKALNINSVYGLLSEENIRDRYLGSFCVEKNFKPDTIKKYLTSLQEFYIFLVLRKDQLCLNISADVLDKCQQNIRRWKRTYRRSSNQQFWRRQMSDFEVLVDKKQVETYRNSKIYADTKALFHQLEESNSPELLNIENYCSVRDYFFIEIGLSNAHRSGVYANFLMCEYLSGSFRNGFWIFLVEKHKTDGTHGPATITINQEEKSYLDIYINKARPLRHPNCENVFVSWRGHKMRSGAISRQISELWKRLGLAKPGKKNISCTILRKSASTNARDAGDTRLQEVADLMGHNKATSDKHYNIRKKQLSAAAGTEALRGLYHTNIKDNNSDKNDGLYHTNIKDNNSDKSDESDDTDDEWIAESECDSDESESGSNEDSEGPVVMFVDNDEQTINGCSKYPGVNINTPHTPRKTWENIEVSQIEEVLRESPNQSLMDFARENKNVFCATEKQLYDKARKLKGRKILLDGRKGGRSCLWKSPDKRVLREKCRNMINGKSKMGRGDLQNALEGTRILENFTIAQIQSRLQHERNTSK